MKKLGIIFTISTLLTISGVYATFNYAKNDPVSKSENILLKLEGKTIDSKKGIINVDTNFFIEIDDYNQTLTTQSKSYGNTIISFTPSLGADQDVKNNGIKLGLVINIITDVPSLSINGQDMFTIKNGAHEGTTLNNGKPIKEEINIDLNDYFQVNEISLPYEENYDKYKWNLEGTSISFTIYEIL